eukprot:evm.model.scf_1827.4 EVM.evm.TU.scf_1827.4   scf_1827:25091-26235(+)
MEDTAEAKEYQERLQEALGQGMDAELEDEALEEYKVLELEVLPAAPKAPAEPLPSVPKTVRHMSTAASPGPARGRVLPTRCSWNAQHARHKATGVVAKRCEFAQAAAAAAAA